MPEFSNPFAGMSFERKLSKEELIRAIRFSIAAEYEAIQLYMQLHDSTDDELAQKVLLDISNEEKEHVGEFLKLLSCLCPEEETFYDEGKQEVEDIIKNLKKNL